MHRSTWSLVFLLTCWAALVKPEATLPTRITAPSTIQPTVLQLPSLCNVTSDCGPYSSCSSGTCVCVAGFEPTLGQKVACARRLGSWCNSTEECGLNAQCSTGHRRCLCIEGYHEVANSSQCQYAKHRLGAQCTVDQDCGLEAVCTDGQCRCRSEAVAQGNQIDCRPNRSLLGTGCEPSQDQCGELAVCRDEVCQCLRGFVASPNRVSCIPTNDIPCISSYECGRFAQCTNGTCLCEKNAKLVDGKCSIVLTTFENTLILAGLVGFGILVILLFSLTELFEGRPKRDSVDCPLIDVQSSSNESS